MYISVSILCHFNNSQADIKGTKRKKNLSVISGLIFSKEALHDQVMHLISVQNKLYLASIFGCANNIWSNSASPFKKILVTFRE